jgi:hypothetical protein
MLLRCWKFVMSNQLSGQLMSVCMGSVCFNTETHVPRASVQSRINRNHHCCGLNIQVTPKFTYWNLNLQGAGIKRWSPWGWLGHEGSALVDGIGAHIKGLEGENASYLLFAMWGHSLCFLGGQKQYKAPSWKQWGSPNPTLDLLRPWFWTSVIY